MRLWILPLLLLSTISLAKDRHEIIKVGIVDTGLDLNDPRFVPYLCDGGHRDFTGHGLDDYESHGTHVAGLIKLYAGEGNYCLLIYKFFHSLETTGKDALMNEISAFREAIVNGATVINFSGGGGEYNENECDIIRNNPGVTFVVAAGNESKNIETKEGQFFPASCFEKNEHIVGNTDIFGLAVSSSNWANRKIDWEIGQDQVSTLPHGKMGTKSGTSMSAAIKTGKLIRKMLNAAK
jgi:thermitase